MNYDTRAVERIAQTMVMLLRPDVSPNEQESHDAEIDTN